MPLTIPPRATAVTPADLGYDAMTYDPGLSSTSGSLGTAGTLHLAKIYNTQALTVSSVSLYITAAGATLTNVGVGIWNTGAAGALRASSVNANGATTAAFAATGEKIVTFSTPPVVTTEFYVGWWTTGTTMPTYMRASTLGGVNVGLAVNSARYATSSTGLTTTAPSTLGTLAVSAFAWWVGVN